MAKIRLTKGELKRQRDALRQYERYLPTLQLKKQQLQIEILRQTTLLEDRRAGEKSKRKTIDSWIGLLTDPQVDIRQWVKAQKVVSSSRNIAGVDLPVFKSAEFKSADYDFFVYPLWADSAIEELRMVVSLREEIKIVEEWIRILRHELRITTQRVNLFEKLKIPEAQETIRLIKIYIGDQMTNAVGRSKMAKRKIEEAVLSEA